MQRCIFKKKNAFIEIKGTKVVYLWGGSVKKICFTPFEVRGCGGCH